MTTGENRPATHGRGELAWVLLGVLALAIVAVKVSNRFDLHLPWLYAVAAGVNVAIVSAWANRRRRRRLPD